MRISSQIRWAAAVNCMPHVGQSLSDWLIVREGQLVFSSVPQPYLTEIGAEKCRLLPRVMLARGERRSRLAADNQLRPCIAPNTLPTPVPAARRRTVLMPERVG